MIKTLTEQNGAKNGEKIKRIQFGSNLRLNRISSILILISRIILMMDPTLSQMYLNSLSDPDPGGTKLGKYTSNVPNSYPFTTHS